MTKEFENAQEEYVRRYADREAKKAFARAERIRDPHVDTCRCAQCVKGAARDANYWIMDYAPDAGGSYLYEPRLDNNGQLILYHEIEDNAGRKNRGTESPRELPPPDDLEPV
ncbi:MAG TPA: hypothetical protein VFF49_11290 [Thermodesulfobacteriota bacterium]|nr:hypothetical protein [Thermodesulfobacteriota bacterium]